MAAEPAHARSSIVAVYPDHAAAEQAVRLLHEHGFAMSDLSIVGRDYQVTEEPVGFISASDFAASGAVTGAWAGGLFGLLIGAAFLVLPGLGPVFVAGPLAAVLLGGVEGAVAGAVVGGLVGGLVGWGVPKDQALKYESHVKAGKFLLIAHGSPQEVVRARELLAPHAPEDLQVYETTAV
jgi:uncharacterized membrane protein